MHRNINNADSINRHNWFNTVYISCFLFLPLHLPFFSHSPSVQWTTPPLSHFRGRNLLLFVVIRFFKYALLSSYSPYIPPNGAGIFYPKLLLMFQSEKPCRHTQIKFNSHFFIDKSQILYGNSNIHCSLYYEPSADTWSADSNGIVLNLFSNVEFDLWGASKTAK